MFAGAAGSESLQVEVTDLPAADGSPVSVVVPLPSVTPVATEPPESSVFFYRFMRIGSVETELLEHPSMDGFFNGYIRAQVLTHSQAEFEGAYPVEDITITTEVG